MWKKEGWVTVWWQLFRYFEEDDDEEEDVMSMICGNALQNGKNLEERETNASNVVVSPTSDGGHIHLNLVAIWS